MIYVDILMNVVLKNVGTTNASLTLMRNETFVLCKQPSFLFPQTLNIDEL